MKEFGLGKRIRFLHIRYIYFPALILMMVYGRAEAQPIPADSLTSLYRVKHATTNGLLPDSLGPQVTVAGIANVGTGVFHEQYLQIFIQNDSTGLSLFNTSTQAAISPGDSVVAAGRIQLYYGSAEVQVDHYNVYPNPEASLQPINLFEALKDSSRHIGMLVHGTGIIKDKGFSSGGKYLAIAPSDTSHKLVTLFVSNFNTNYPNIDFNTPAIGDVITVTGIVGPYNHFFPDKGHYTVYLRTAADISFAGWPRYYFRWAAIILGLAVLIGAGWMISLKLQVGRKTRALKISLEEKKALLQEIHHRVKNNLAAISGLLHLQSETSENKEVQQALQESQSRVISMGMIHEKLYRSESLAGISMDTYLRELAETVHHTFANEASHIDMEVGAEAVELQTDRVVPLGLLVNELLVNAFKHAFKGRSEGSINIQLSQKQQNFVLKVEDDGVGLPDDINIAASDSLGMLLIDIFSKQLQAKKTLQNTPGACLLFTFPVDVDG